MNQKDVFTLGVYVVFGMIGGYVGLSLVIRFIGWLIDPTFKPYKR